MTTDEIHAELDRDGPAWESQAEAGIVLALATDGIVNLEHIRTRAQSAIEATKASDEERTVYAAELAELSAKRMPYQIQKTVEALGFMLGHAQKCVEFANRNLALRLALRAAEHQIGEGTDA